MAEAINDFGGYQAGLDSPVSKGFAITTHDTNELEHITRGIWVGGTGSVVVILQGDTVAVTLAAVPAGTLLPIRAKVITTASGATLMIGLY